MIMIQNEYKSNTELCKILEYLRFGNVIEVEDLSSEISLRVLSQNQDDIDQVIRKTKNNLS